eukprot:PhM_4_TR2138/c0_g1_i1/m.9258
MDKAQADRALTLLEFLEGAAGYKLDDDFTPKDTRDDMLINGFPRHTFATDEGLTPIRVSLPPFEAKPESTQTPKMSISVADMARLRRVVPVHSVELDGCHRVATAYVSTPHVGKSDESEDCRALLSTLLVALVLQSEDVSKAAAYLASECNDKKNKFVGRANIRGLSANYKHSTHLDEGRHCVLTIDQPEMCAGVATTYIVGCPANIQMARAAVLFSIPVETEAFCEDVVSQLREAVDDPANTISLEVLDMPYRFRHMVFGSQGKKQHRIERSTGALIWSNQSKQLLYVFGGDEEREYAKALVAVAKEYGENGNHDSSSAPVANLMRMTRIPVPKASVGFVCGQRRLNLFELEDELSVVISDQIFEDSPVVTISGHNAIPFYVLGSHLNRWRVALEIARLVCEGRRYHHYLQFVKNLAMTTTDIETTPSNEFGADVFFSSGRAHLFEIGHLRRRFGKAADVAAAFLTWDHCVVIGRKQYRDLFKWLVMQRTSNKSDVGVMTTVV